MASALLFLLVALVGASCGDDEPRIATIAVIAPLDGGLVEFGRGIRNSVQLAVEEANATRPLPAGWRLKVLALDDSSDPAKGEAAAKQAVADPTVVGVVGTYNSGVAARVIPVLDAAGIAMISPANTDATLTLGADPAHPVRPHDNYFRTVAADNVQGPFLARYAYGDLGARRVSVVTQSKAVSKGLADAFSAAFVGAGGEIVSTKVVPDGTTDYDQAIQEILPLRPDLVFYGGEYDVGWNLAAQAQAAGVTAAVMGGDGLKNDAYITKAGQASDGDLASTVGAPTASMPSARHFLEAYARAGYQEPPSDYGVYAYDATNALIAGARFALEGTDRVAPEVREAVVVAVQAVELGGASGVVTFDEFGDTTSKVLTVYQVKAGTWQPVKTDEVS